MTIEYSPHRINLTGEPFSVDAAVHDQGQTEIFGSPEYVVFDDAGLVEIPEEQTPPSGFELPSA